MMLSVLLFAGAGARAKSEIKWINDSYDFGVMREADGKQTGFARFVNEGPDTTWIDYVRPSCGCTDADYTKGMLASGDTAVVGFTYNPLMRPGKFDKTVKVYIGADKERHVINISGTVVGTPQTLSAQFPVECGPLRFTERLIDLGQVQVGTGRHTFVTMVNQSMDSISPRLALPQGVSGGLSPQTLGPGDLGTIGIYLNSSGSAVSQLGEQTIKIPVETDSCTMEIAIRADFIQRQEAEAEAKKK